MLSAYLNYLTLTTGHLSRVYRDEVDPESIQGATEALERARDERVPMPGLGHGYAMTVTAEGRSAMLCTIWCHEAPVVTIGVARTSKASAALWRILLQHSVGTLAVDETARPAPPWVASRIEAGALQASPDVLTEIGGMGGVIGWAFLEMYDPQTL